MTGAGPIRPPDLAEVVAFVAAVEEGSLTRAAARLGISQPAMTKRIRVLETLTGVHLLERGPRGARATEAGRRLHASAVHLVRAAEEFAEAAAALRGDRTLRLAVIFSLAEHHVAQWLGAHRDSADAGPVEVRVGTPEEVRDWVARGDSDLGFAAGRPGSREGIVERVFAQDALVAVVPSGHPWARRGTVDAGVLTAGPVILREPGSGTRRTFDDAVARAGLGPVAPALTLASTSAIRNAVANEGIPAVLSRLSVDVDRTPDLAVVRVRGLDLGRPLTVLWRDGAVLSAEQRRFLESSRVGDACAGDALDD